MVIKSWLFVGLVVATGSQRLGYVNVEPGVSVPVWVVGFNSMPAAKQEHEYDFLDAERKLDLAVYVAMITEEPKNTHWQIKFLTLGSSGVRKAIGRFARTDNPAEAASLLHLLRLFAMRFHGKGFVDDDILLVKKKEGELDDPDVAQKAGLFLEALRTAAGRR